MSGHLLEKTEEYPQWTVYTRGLLRLKDCADAIQPFVPFTANDARQELIQSGFTAGQLTNATLVKIVQDRKDKDKAKLSKAAGIIVNQVAQQHQHLIVEKTPHEMWETLRERFQDVSPLNSHKCTSSNQQKEDGRLPPRGPILLHITRKILNETIGMLAEDYSQL